MPCEPSASKKASCGLTATQDGAAASMSPRQKRATASARASGTSPTSPWSSTGSNSTTGSSPSTSWLRLRSTQSTSRSPKTVVPVSTCVIALTLGDGAAVDLVEAQHAQLGRRAPQELRDDE